jgi:hypothetical protein
VELSDFLDARQETILYIPPRTGTYRLEVESYYGAGAYWLDVSAATSLK